MRVPGPCFEGHPKSMRGKGVVTGKMLLKTSMKYLIFEHFTSKFEAVKRYDANTGVVQ